LAGDALDQIRTPTLLIVGGSDFSVIELNEQAFSRLRGPKLFEIVAGAGHLFPEPGALEAVIAYAASWFKRHLGSSSHPVGRQGNETRQSAIPLGCGEPSRCSPGGLQDFGQGKTCSAARIELAQHQAPIRLAFHPRTEPSSFPVQRPQRPIHVRTRCRHQLETSDLERRHCGERQYRRCAIDIGESINARSSRCS
jgi:hypothetical protein